MNQDGTDGKHGSGVTGDRQRRRLIKLVAAGVTVGIGGAAAPVLAGPQAGDRLVMDDAEGAPVPLRASDLTPGKPILAYPFDPATTVVRNGSRLDKVMLIKFADAELDASIRPRTAGGVLAFSAICTHQACEVKTWIAKERVLVCYCHSSKFQPLEAGKVVDGPATRSLPSLPLVLQDDQLVVAGPFSARPGPGA